MSHTLNGRKSRRKKAKRLQKRLASYTAMAAAAGATSATDAEASLVIHDIGVTSPLVYMNGVNAYAIVVDIDGGVAGYPLDYATYTPDVYLASLVESGSELAFVFGATEEGGGIAYAELENKEFALQLSPSTYVGPELDFSEKTYVGIGDSSQTFGYWGRPDRGFLGVQFEIDTELHYGWLDMSINDDWSITVHRAAYEDVPGDPAHVPDDVRPIPEPVSGLVWLTMLSAGAAGVHEFRRQCANREAA